MERTNLNNQPKRKQLRLKGYDYRRAGLYFITVCCYQRACLFGNIKNGIMQLNDAGRMVEQFYRELENKYPDKKCREFIVMPNHFHCIIENIAGGDDRDQSLDARENQTDQHGHPNENTVIDKNPQSPYGLQNKKINVLIGETVGWFKTMTTNAYIRGVKEHGWKRFNKRLWQTNYYEHIIRNEKSHRKIADYIINNPAQWNEDLFHEHSE